MELNTKNTNISLFPEANEQNQLGILFMNIYFGSQKEIWTYNLTMNNVQSPSPFSFPSFSYFVCCIILSNEQH